MSRPFLTVVIPAFNEEARLGSTLDTISDYLSGRRTAFELIVVDDGSSDDTVALAAEWGARRAPGSIRVLRNEVNRGKGYSVRRGVLESQGRYALLTDADLSTPVEELEKLEPFVVGGESQMAIGSRDIEGSVIEVHQSWLREYSGKFFNLLIRWFVGLPFRDTQCGFKLFDMEACREVFESLDTSRYGFDVELLLIARERGLQIREVPVVWRHDEASKVRFIRDGSRMIWDLARILIKRHRGRYHFQGD